jgi:hypothetical protein
MPTLLTDPSGLLAGAGCYTVENREPQESPAPHSQDGGPFADGDSLAPDPQRPSGGCGYLPGGGGVSVDGADVTDWTGDGVPIFGGAYIFGWESNTLIERPGAWNWVSAFLSSWSNGDPENGDSNNRGGTKKYTVNLKVLNDCLSKMNIHTSINSFTPSTPGGYGKASGKGEDWFSGHGNTVPITVTNDANTYNFAQISDKAGVPAFGFTDPFHPYTNYTNNNNNAYGTVDTQVWELGNSLWRIQAGSPFIPWPSVEPGKTLENCVRNHNGIQPQ